MSNALLIVNDDGRLVPHTEEAIDEWFRSLPSAIKVRIFWLELETPTLAGALYDRSRQQTAPRRGTAPVTAAADGGMLASILCDGGSWYTVTLDTACFLAGAGAIAECVAEPGRAGSEASLYFEVIDQAVFAREMSL